MHDFKRFPELTAAQMEIYYFESPHKQIVNDIRATVIKVHDGDTITVRWKERDFDFPVRLARINAPELNEDGGDASRDLLKQWILGDEVDLLIDPSNRVEKWGRLLAEVIAMGLNMSDMMMSSGMATPFEFRHEGKILPLEVMLK